MFPQGTQRRHSWWPPQTLRIYLSSCLGLNNRQGVYLGFRPLRESGRIRESRGSICWSEQACSAWSSQHFVILDTPRWILPCLETRLWWAATGLLCPAASWGILWVHRECVSVSVQSHSVSVGFKPDRMQGVPWRAHSTSHRTGISVTRPGLTSLQGPATDSEQRMDQIHGLANKTAHTRLY